MKTFTFKEFKAKYATDDNCLDELFRQRFGSYTECPKCDNMFHYKRVSSRSKTGAQRKSYQCVSCGNQLYPLAGTIYSKSRTPLNYWFYALFLLTNTRNGVSAKELERMIGVTYKTAFRMLHQLRLLMNTTHDGYMDGVVMIDEAYTSGRLINMHNSRKEKLRENKEVFKHKQKVLGLIQQGGIVKAKMIESVSVEDIIPEILKSVAPGSIIVTDGANHYKGLSALGYTHRVIRHDLEQYVDECGYTTNPIEGFWSQLKRMIKGTHIKVSNKYLQRYLDECCYRYDNRDNHATMFYRLLQASA